MSANLVAKSVDFRKGHDGLAALVKNELHKDPFTGTVFVFRSRRVDRLKLIYWDGSAIVLAYKGLEGHSFTQTGIKDGLMTLSHAQFEALLAGLDWKAGSGGRNTRALVAIEQLRHDDSARQIPEAKRIWFWQALAMLDVANLPDDNCCPDDMISTTSITREDTVYSIVGASDTPRTVLIEQMKRPGWTFRADDITDGTPTKDRIKTVVKAGETKVVTSTLSVVNEESFGLADAGSDELIQWQDAANGPAIRGKLVELVKAKATQDAASQTLQELGRGLIS